MTRLRKLDSIVLPKIIISIHTMQLGRIICFAFSDGTVQYRDRFTMNEVYNELNLTSIMSPHQVGFQFTNETPCECRATLCLRGERSGSPYSPGLQVAFSTTNCSFVQICEDGSIRWSRLYYPMDNISTELQGGRQWFSHTRGMLHH